MVRANLLLLVLVGAGLAGSNLAVTAILAPWGIIDSGQRVIPQISVRNCGPDPSGEYFAFLRFEQNNGSPIHFDSRLCDSLPVDSSTRVTFDEWLAQGRGPMITEVWSFYAGDSVPYDDTLGGSFFVRVRDVGVTEILAPRDTLDSGIVVYPRARVSNLGSQGETFDVQFVIGSYSSVRTVTLASGRDTMVAAPDPYHTSPGCYVHRVAASLIGDQHPENNNMVDTFWVRGTLWRDVGVLRILAPADTVYAGTNVAPAALVADFGAQPETFWAWFRIFDSTGAQIYGDESTQVMVGPYDSIEVQFTPDVSFTPGWYVAVCSIDMRGDSNPQNDFLMDTVWVVTRPGVEESPKPQAASSKLTATVVRGILLMAEAASLKPQAASLLDISGREVMALKPGVNDVLRLAPGVYFVRHAQAQAQAQVVHKVIVQR